MISYKMYGIGLGEGEVQSTAIICVRRLAAILGLALALAPQFIAEYGKDLDLGLNTDTAVVRPQ